MLVKRSFGSYNDRRYGRPWGAKVSFPDGIKPMYEFVGHWDGEHVLLNAEVGSVVAFGQKDNRGNNSTKILYIVGDDGELTRVSESEAREHATAHPQ